MTKQARRHIIEQIEIGAIKQLRSPQSFAARDAYRKGLITPQEASARIDELMIVTARLGKNEPPPHCPRRTTSANKPTNQRRLYN